MYISDDVICRICDKVFCCSECRLKHEMTIHGIIIDKETNANVPGEQQQSNNIETIYLCPICQKSSFPLTAIIPNEILEHIEQHHLPLQCVKCLKIFQNMDDLKSFTKCTEKTVPSNDHNCCIQQQTDGDKISASSSSSSLTDSCKLTVKASPLLSMPKSASPIIMTQTISTQTTPTIVMQHDSHSIRTPSNNNNNNNNNFVMMNCTQLKIKTSKTSYTHFLSDHSVSSVKNVSSLSNHSASLKRNIVETSLVKRKIIRSTSTPLQVEMMKITDKSKSTEHTFGVAGISAAQISSICANESNASSGYTNANIHQSPLYHDGVSGSASANGSSSGKGIGIGGDNAGIDGYQYRKMMAISNRRKMLTVTPLRHVISKNMHKAIAAHNLMVKSPFEGGIPAGVTDHSCHAEYKNLQITSPLPQALDLRLSPAVRRNREEIKNKIISASCHSNSKSNEIVLSAQKVTTEAIVITAQTKHMAAAIAYNHLRPKSQDLLKSYHHAHHGQHLTASTSGMQITWANNTNTKKEIKHPHICLEKSYNINSNNNSIKTPIGRISGAIINKKLIKFDESLEGEENYSSGNSNNSRNSSSDSNNDIFVTPNTTPNKYENKMKYHHHHQALANGNKRNIADTNDTNQKMLKPNLKYCAHSTAFSCIEDFDDNDADDDANDDANDDDVFIEKNEEKHVTKEPKRRLQVNDNQMMNKMAGVVSSAVNVGGLWSALMSSMTRFSAMKTVKSSETKNTTYIVKPFPRNITTKSIIKKCASFVTGTLMKPSMADDVMQCNQDTVIKPLKRKRPSMTHLERSCDKSPNLLSSINSSISPSSDLSNATTKRFRIQGRRPIYRLRFDS